MIHTCLEVIEISEIEASVAEVRSRHFTDRDDLGGPPISTQTVAGFLAVKRAIAALARRVSGLEAVSTREIAIARRAGRAPCWIDGDPRVKISISHTSERAYGLAAFEGD